MLHPPLDRSSSAVSVILGKDAETLRTELAETQARLREAQGELARLVCLAEAQLQRQCPSEQSSVVAASVRRPAAKDVVARIARLVQLYREASAAAPKGVPVVGEDMMLRWRETVGLFDRDIYLTCNGDMANAGGRPDSARLQSRLRRGTAAECALTPTRADCPTRR